MSDKHQNPRARRTRAALIAAGRKLFSERALDAVTVDDIVRAAGVGKGSFYNHFADRDALRQQVAADIRARIELSAARANVGVDDPARRVVRAVCTYFRFVLDDPERARVLARNYGGHTASSAPLNRGLVEDLTAGLERGRFCLSTLEAGMLFVLGVAQVGFLRILHDPAQAPAVSLAQQLCGMLLRGLGLTAAEADLLSAQASDDVVRRGTFASAFLDGTEEPD